MYYNIADSSSAEHLKTLKHCLIKNHTFLFVTNFKKRKGQVALSSNQEHEG